MCLKMSRLSDFIIRANGVIKFGGNVSRRSRQRFEIEEASIDEVRRTDITQPFEHRTANVRYFFFEVLNQVLDSLALEVLLRAAEITRDDGKVAKCRIASNVLLPGISQRPDDRIATIIRLKDRRH